MRGKKLFLILKTFYSTLCIIISGVVFLRGTFGEDVRLVSRGRHCSALVMRNLMVKFLQICNLTFQPLYSLCHKERDITRINTKKICRNQDSNLGCFGHNEEY